MPFRHIIDVIRYVLVYVHVYFICSQIIYIYINMIIICCLHMSILGYRLAPIHCRRTLQLDVDYHQHLVVTSWHDKDIWISHLQTVNTFLNIPTGACFCLSTHMLLSAHWKPICKSQGVLFRHKIGICESWSAALHKKVASHWNFPKRRSSVVD